MPDFNELMREKKGDSLNRVFKDLPNDFLAAMIEGLEDADVIVPGRLFAGDNGGCVVGVTLRVIDPDFQGRGRWSYRTKRKSIKKAYWELNKIFPSLKTLEEVFDQAVRVAGHYYSHCSQKEISTAVGKWFSIEARTELMIREMNSDWLNAIVTKRQLAPTADL